MKQIKKDELYQHLSEFLKRKGIELHKGPYPGRIEQGCRILTDTINATQRTLERARKEMDHRLGRMRQALKKKPSASPAPPPPAGTVPPKVKVRPKKKATRIKPPKKTPATRRRRTKSSAGR